MTRVKIGPLEENECTEDIMCIMDTAWKIDGRAQVTSKKGRKGTLVIIETGKPEDIKEGMIAGGWMPKSALKKPDTVSKEEQSLTLVLSVVINNAEKERKFSNLQGKLKGGRVVSKNRTTGSTYRIEIQMRNRGNQAEIVRQFRANRLSPSILKK
ncbi:MAG: hypothetical protein ABIF92_01905 [archaeon]